MEICFMAEYFNFFIENLRVYDFCCTFVRILVFFSMSVLQNLTAIKMLQLKAFKFQLQNPITWANGWAAPVYCDDRKILSYPKIRDFVRIELARTIAEMYPDADVIAGVATNAIAHGVLVAEQLNLPFVYVHPTPKDHGLENQIEGDLRPRQSVVVVENQVNVGDNCLKVVKALEDNGCKVLGVVTIFNYDFATTRAKLENQGVDLTALTDLNTVLHHAESMNIINQEQSVALQDWQCNPSSWTKSL